MGEERRAPLGSAALLDRLEHPGGGAPHGDRVGVLDRQRVELREHAQAGLELGRIDAGLRFVRAEPIGHLSLMMADANRT